MRIYDMFAKKIDRPITGVIKVGQIADSDISVTSLKIMRGALILQPMKWVYGSPASLEVVNHTS